MSRIPERSSAHYAYTWTHCLKSSLSGLHASCLYRSMDWEAACVSIHSAGVGFHIVLGLSACFWLWKLRTRTLRDQLHHQLVISDLIYSAARSTVYIQVCRQLCCKHVSGNLSACITISRWRMRSSLNDRIYIFLILILCFGFPSLTIVTSYLAILLTVRMWHKMEDLGTVSVIILVSCFSFLFLEYENYNSGTP